MKAMAQKNEIPALLLSLGTTVLLVGGGLWWITRHTDLGQALRQTLPQSGSSPVPASPQSPSAAPPGQSSPGQLPLEQRLSRGEHLLVPGVTTPEKEAAIAAIAAGEFDQAIPALEISLQQQRNDPEALIYLNNARIGSQKSWTLAVAAPLATAVDPAQELLRGVAQAQTQINQSGGINGVPIHILIASDDNDPALAPQIATALVNDPSVLGVIGHFGSETSLAAGAVYQAGGLVMVSPTSTTTQLSGFGSYIFRTVPSDRFTATTLSRHLISGLGQQKAVVYFNAESDYSQSLKNEFTTALYSDGGEVIAEFNVADPGFNPQSSLQQAEQQGAEVMVLLTNTATLDSALQLIAANQQRLAILGGDSLYNPQVLRTGGKAAEEMVVAVPWVLLSHPNTPFVTQARQLWGGDVNWRTAMAYDGLLALAEALKANPSRQGLQAVLANPDFKVQGATGLVRFLPSGDRNQAMQLVKVEPGKRSGFGYDFVPIKP